MPLIPIPILYCGTGFAKSLFDKMLYEFDAFPVMVPFHAPVEFLRVLRPGGLIISGSGSYVHDPKAERVDPRVWTMGVPVLGICYGMQRMAVDLGGEVKRMANAEKDEVLMQLTEPGRDSPLFQDFADPAAAVWMSHNTKVTRIPDGFITTGATKMGEIAAMEDRVRNFYGVQFHPEHLAPKDIAAGSGTTILWNFLSKVCGLHAGIHLQESVAHR